MYKHTQPCTTTIPPPQARHFAEQNWKRHRIHVEKPCQHLDVLESLRCKPQCLVRWGDGSEGQSKHTSTGALVLVGGARVSSGNRTRVLFENFLLL